MRDCPNVLLHWKKEVTYAVYSKTLQLVQNMSEHPLSQVATLYTVSVESMLRRRMLLLPKKLNT